MSDEEKPEPSSTKKAQSDQLYALARAHAAAGRPLVAGLLRVEASNALARPDNWKPIHKPALGPYTAENPARCVNCGRPSGDPLNFDLNEDKGDRGCPQDNVEPGS